ncbi:MAG: hypothetical protein KDC95_05340 [Planctomycetes bacterium]|nr:hypothetical protein [Planctomycetota bacterium]
MGRHPIPAWLKVVAGSVIVWIALRIGVAIVWSSPTVSIDGVPSAAGLDDSITIRVSLSYHAPFELRSVGYRVREPLVAGTLAGAPGIPTGSVPWSATGLVPWPRSDERSVTFTLRSLFEKKLGASPSDAAAAPAVLRGELRVEGWYVSSYADRMTFWLGRNRLRLFHIVPFEIRVDS